MGSRGQLQFQFVSNSGSTTSTRNQLQLNSYHLLPRHNYFYEGLGNFLQSSVQGIRLQTTLGGGIGYFFKDTNTSTIDVVGGLAWQPPITAHL